MKATIQIILGTSITSSILIGLLFFPNRLWNIIVQLIAMSLLIVLITPYTSNYFEPLKLVEDNPWTSVLFASIVVIFVNMYQVLFPEYDRFNEESFVGSENAIGHDIYKLPRGFCPPELDLKNNIDTDTEPQQSSCLPNVTDQLAQETKLDDIDTYLRESDEAIRNVNKYLKTEHPDERWLSKKHMEDPNARNLVKPFQ